MLRRIIIECALDNPVDIGRSSGFAPIGYYDGVPQCSASGQCETHMSSSTGERAMPSTEVTTEKLRLKQVARNKFSDVCAKLGPDDIALDCGANVGEFTEILAQTGCRVFAFEPDPFAFARLTERMGGMPNVQLFNAAVSISDGVARLYFHRDRAKDVETMSQGSSLLPEKPNVSKNSYKDVQVIDVVAFVSKLDRPVSLFKLDVEGEEARILEGLLNTNVIDRIGHMFVETHEHKIDSIREKIEWVRQNIRQRRLVNIDLNWR